MQSLKTWSLFLLGLIGLLLLNQQLLSSLHARDRSRRVDWLRHGDPENSPFILLGSSAARYGVNLDQLESGLKAGVTDLSHEGSAYPEQRLVAELYLSRNTATTLLFQVDTWGITTGGYSHPYHEYEFIPHLNEPIIRRDLKRQFGPLRSACWNYVPMFAFAEFNEQIGLLSFHSDQLRHGASSHSYNPNVEQMLQRTFNPGAKRTPTNSIENALSLERMQACREVLELARQKGLQTIMFMPPVHLPSRTADTEHQARVQWYQNLAAEFGVPFFVDESEEFLNPKLFADSSHLNQRGAPLFTDHLIEFILKDHNQ